MNCSHPYGDFSYNSTCVFGCQEGFERRGAGTLRCLASQQWSAETPTCTGRACQGLGGSRGCGTDALWGSALCAQRCSGKQWAGLAMPLPFGEAAPGAACGEQFSDEAAMGRVTVSSALSGCPSAPARCPESHPGIRTLRAPSTGAGWCLGTSITPVTPSASPQDHSDTPREGDWHLGRSSEKNEGGLPSCSQGKGVSWQGWATTGRARTGEMRLDIGWEGQSGAGSHKGEKAVVCYAAGEGKVPVGSSRVCSQALSAPERCWSFWGACDSPAPPSLCHCVVHLHPCTRVG